MPLALVVLLFAPSAFGQAKDSLALDARLRAETAPFKGKVFLFAKNLETGKTYSFEGDERVRTASTIKIAVMVEAFGRVAEGRAKWTDELVLTKAARYGGSGVLPELADGLRLTLRDCVNLMMLISDNTATNMVLDYLTTDAVNARMNSLGFKSTHIMRRVARISTISCGVVAPSPKRLLSASFPSLLSPPLPIRRMMRVLLKPREFIRALTASVVR